MRLDAVADEFVKIELSIDSFHLHDCEEVEAAVVQFAHTDVLMQSEPQMNHVIL